MGKHMNIFNQLRVAGALATAMLAAFASPSFASTQNLDFAPPAFGPNNSYVPIDISTVAIDYTFDAEKRKAFAKATMTFRQKVAGKPFFDIVPDASELTLNGESLDPKALIEVKPPGEITTLRVLDKSLEPGKDHVLTISYNIHRRAKYRRGTVRVGFFVSDLDDRWFFERFGPTNLQFDQIQYTFNVTVKGAKEDHRIFANGDVVATGDHSWRVTYPDWYNTSTLYFHLVPNSLVTVLEGVYKGKERDIPVVVYNQSGKRLQKYLDESIAKLGKLEERFGPSTHPKYTIYVHGGGGMEYAGATITSPGALGHELTHSWYARGIFPADGKSSWVDEAVASWQDSKYERAKTGPSGPPVNLADLNVYVRDTNVKAYREGRILMTQLDFMLKDQGGLSPILASFYERTKRGMLTTTMFRDHLQKESGQDMTAIFDKYVYGKGSFATEEFAVDRERLPEVVPVPSKHPRRFTLKELYDAQ